MRTRCESSWLAEFPLKHLSRRYFRAKLWICVAILGTSLIINVYFIFHGAVCRMELSYLITDSNNIDLKVSNNKIDATVLNEENNRFHSTDKSKTAQDDGPFLADSLRDTRLGLVPDCRAPVLNEGQSDLRQSGARSHNGTTSCKPCPRRSPYLKNRRLQADTQPVNFQDLVVKYPNMETGGRQRPGNCLALQRLAVIIPFRDRHEHLMILLNNLIPFLSRQLADVTFFIIEQESSSTFNRGALMNVGFLEARKIADFDCFIFHDVDLLPLNEANLYRCGDKPHHFAVAINKYDYNLYYEGYFGGVVGFSTQQYLDINGNSNLYFGWGGEDDDLLRRCLSKGYYVSRYTPMTATYDMIKHEIDKGNEVNENRNKILKSAALRQDAEGLSTLKYKVISKKLRQLYTWITVSLDMTQIMQSAPSYVLQDLHKTDPVRNMAPDKRIQFTLLGVLLFIFHSFSPALHSLVCSGVS